MKTQEATWPYSTYDEVSHLACEDVDVLRARIDQLLEERRNWRKIMGYDADVELPLEWRLTATEHRLFAALVIAKSGGIVSKASLHTALSGIDEPDTDPKIVDVVVCKVRKKLEPFGIEIQTAWGKGYYLDLEVRQRFRSPPTR